MKSTINLLCIIGSSVKTHFMQSSDLFSSDKVLGELQHMSISFDNHKNWSDITELIPVIRESLEKSSMIVSFINVINIDNHGRDILTNKGNIPPYINKQIRMISDGEKWGMLHKLLEDMGFKVTTDQNMYVREITH